MERQQIEAILGRPVAAARAPASLTVLRGATVLVTGAGGSIGSALCRSLLTDPGITVIALDASEVLLHGLIMSVGPAAGSRLVPVLGSVSNLSTLRRVMQTHAPATIFHAAAYKHVSLLETNVAEAVRNNVLGTWTLCQVASETAERLVFISTDKAVEPVSVMGATKRLGEEIVSHFNRTGHRRFTSVRSGNVFGSSGSLIPLVIAQLNAGGPVTVTDSRATRYFVTLDEAVNLALWAAELTRGGDGFVFDAGPPVPVLDIVNRLIALSRPTSPPAIVFTGLRPGERLHERLFAPGEARAPTDVPGLWRVDRPAAPHQPDLPARVERLAEAVDRQDEAFLRTLLFAPQTGGEP